MQVLQHKATPPLLRYRIRAGRRRPSAHGDLHGQSSSSAVKPAAARGVAKKLGLDIERFDRDVADETHVPHLFEDFNSAVHSGVNGAPTFSVNGARLDWDFETATLGDALESTLSVAREARPA